jgi:hypothetical protein
VGARSRCNFVRYGTPGSQRGARRGSALGDVLAGCVNSFNPRVIVPGGDLGDVSTSSPDCAAPREAA